ncbi:MAG TPA: type I glyceraldehyde-3-phosphate dehydrogenase [Mycobacteriales bacterium]|nr:type I glyceraldehyde-3-phosphate dehydrogenase [Mycobacteriales bacterium]
MSTRIGINGMGRIGRSFVRIVEGSDLEVVAVNDVTDTRTLAHLLAYDSTYGRLGLSVDYDEKSLYVDGRRIDATSHRDPRDVPWGSLGVDIVIESTGKFRQRREAAGHLDSGARKVLLSAPGKGSDHTFVMGINETEYDPERHDIISNASCTTNCVVPMMKVMNDRFGVSKGFMTTVHAYTGDQMILDAPHKDLHRARTAAVNIIPTSTGAARTVGSVIPALEGKLDGIAVRVPVEDGSLTDLTLLLQREASVEQVNAAFADAASHELAGIVRYNEDPIVSRDIMGDSASCVFDSTLTQANAELVKIFGWYDNEWGYTCRLVDLARHVAARL